MPIYESIMENGHATTFPVAGWQNSKQESALVERKNGYRVLLTRARKGMVIFVPKGDLSKPLEDETRNPEYYDDIYNYLLSCGSISIDE